MFLTRRSQKGYHPSLSHMSWTTPVRSFWTNRCRSASLAASLGRQAWAAQHHPWYSHILNKLWDCVRPETGLMYSVMYREYDWLHRYWIFNLLQIIYKRHVESIWIHCEVPSVPNVEGDAVAQPWHWSSKLLQKHNRNTTERKFLIEVFSTIYIYILMHKT